MYGGDSILANRIVDHNFPKLPVIWLSRPLRVLALGVEGLASLGLFLMLRCIPARTARGADSIADVPWRDSPQGVQYSRTACRSD